VTRITFPATARPLVSAIIVTHGQWPWAERALSALAAHTDEPYEVIVVDNASDDGTQTHLESGTENARLLLNPRNVGFGPACNQGAAAARGDFLVFLNSDTLVQPGWLPPLLSCFEDQAVAAAGPLILSLDGSVQEAGALVSPSYGAAPYGDGDSRERPEYRFRRSVDYVSAACLAVRRTAFHEVGGFDARYGMGYFEDVDLCLSLTTRGYRILYEPRSTVQHARWVSYGESRARDLVEGNRVIFSRRWRGRLGLRPNSLGQEGPRQLVAVRDAPATDRILAVTPEIPARGEPFERLLTVLVTGWPTARVTAVAARDRAFGRRMEALLDAGVEVAQPESLGGWLFERRFHYDVVLVSASMWAAAEPLLAGSQPQAFTVLVVEATDAAEEQLARPVSRVDAILSSSEMTPLDNAADAAAGRVTIPVAAEDEASSALHTALADAFLAAGTTAQRPAVRPTWPSFSHLRRR